MLVLEISLLAGRFAAARFNDRRKAEWPPHPARIFSALTDALHAEEVPRSLEREALRWLASAPPPEIVASNGHVREQELVYVPTNDAAALGSIDDQIVKYEDALTALESTSDPKARKKAEKIVEKAREQLAKRSASTAADDGKGGSVAAARELLPTGRSRQPRAFPVVIPEENVVHVIWAEVPQDEVVQALDVVASRVARLGHSSSLVSLRFFVTDHVEAGSRIRWVPDPDGDLTLRTTAPDQLERLEEAYLRHRAVEQRVLPAVFTRYRDASKERVRREIPSSTFDDQLIVFEVVASPTGAKRLLLDNSLSQHVARAMRGLLIKAADGKLPASLSGHEENGEPTKHPHLAVIALSDVGHSYATGTILGLALVPPQGLAEEDRRALLRTIATAERELGAVVEEDEPPVLALTLGSRGVLYVQRVRGEAERTTTRASTWTRPSRRWASVTAVALDRNPGHLDSRDPDVVERAVAEAEATIARACRNVGLPDPIGVWVHRRSLFEGAAPARRFMPFPLEGNGPKRVCVHAEILFEEPVRGPVLLGAGRFFGLGLFKPREER